MKKVLPRIPKALAVTLIALPAVSITSYANLLAYEGWDYATGNGIAGNGSASGGTGWATGSAWTHVSGFPNNEDIAAGDLTTTGSSADLVSSGNQQVLKSSRIGRFLDTATGGVFDSAGLLDANGNIGLDGTTVYLSFVQQRLATTAKFWEFEIHRDNLNDPGRVSGIGNDSNPVSGVDHVYLRGDSTAIAPADLNANLYVVRIDFKPGNDDVYVWQNPALGVEPATATLVSLGLKDMSFDGISLGAFGPDEDVAHDEFRIGTTYASVTPTTAPPPVVGDPLEAPDGVDFNAYAFMGTVGAEGNQAELQIDNKDGAIVLMSPDQTLFSLGASGTDGLFSIQHPDRSLEKVLQLTVPAVGPGTMTLDGNLIINGTILLTPTGDLEMGNYN